LGEAVLDADFADQRGFPKKKREWTIASLVSAFISEIRIQGPCSVNRKSYFGPA
jgi:hypothetical protein